MKIIKADRIITGDGKTVLENGAVALEGSRIAAVGELSGLTARWPNAPVETMDGCTLLPGLIDMHVHISGLYRRPEKQEMQENPAYLMLMVYKHLQDALGVGITTLRGVGGPRASAPPSGAATARASSRAPATSPASAASPAPAAMAPPARWPRSRWTAPGTCATPCAAT